MAYFQIMLNGRDFAFNFEGGVKIGGFLTTRWVKAKTAEDAELKAVELVKNDQDLHDAIVLSEDTTPMIYLEEIAKVGLFNYLKNSPGKGYTFYSDEESTAGD